MLTVLSVFVSEQVDESIPAVRGGAAEDPWSAARALRAGCARRCSQSSTARRTEGQKCQEQDGSQLDLVLQIDLQVADVVGAQKRMIRKCDQSLGDAT